MSYLNKTRIIPTIFSHNKKEFDYKLNKLVLIAKKLQIDFMDGVFVPGKSVEPRFIPDLSEFNNIFEAHLMVMNPIGFFEKIKDKGFKKIIFHLESFTSVDSALNFFNDLKKQKIIPVLAVNPLTRLDELIIMSFDFFLIMGVQPGKEKQCLKESVFNKISQIKKLNPGAKIQVDGGVNPKNSSKLFKAGVDYLNSGSFISESDDPRKALLDLLKEV